MQLYKLNVPTRVFFVIWSVRDIPDVGALFCIQVIMFNEIQMKITYLFSMEHILNTLSVQ